MQIIPTIKLPLQLTLQLRIPQHSIEIEHLVENVTFPNPLVNSLPRLLTLGVAVGLAREIGRRAEGGDGRAEDGDSECVDAVDDLRVRLREAGVHGGLGVGCGRRGTDVVYAFENEDVLHARVGEDVALDSTQGIRSETVSKNAISARSEVRDSNVACAGRFLEACEEEIGPAVVLVGDAAAAVGDGVAEEGERAGGARDPGFDGRDEVPVCCALGFCIRDGERWCGHGVAELPPASRAATWVGCDAVGRLASCKVDGNGDHGLGLYLEVEWVGDGESTVGDADIRAP